MLDRGFEGLEAREDAQAAALAGGVENAGDADFDDGVGSKGAAKKPKRGGPGAHPPPPLAAGGGVMRRHVPGGLAALAGGSGRKYVEFAVEVSGLEALAQADAARRTAQRAAAAAAAVGAPKLRTDVNAALDRM